MAKVDNIIISRVLRHLLCGEDYRIEIVNHINAIFLQFTIDYFMKIVDARLKHESITVDWYKREFLNSETSSEDLILYSGLNKKTITNMYNRADRQTVVQATLDHYDSLYDTVNRLIEHDDGVDIELVISFRGVSVRLNVSESLIIINTLAAKRASLRGSAWSSTGKQVEKYLMKTLCVLYDIPSNNYRFSNLNSEGREIDFHLISVNQNIYRCEVKLMGKGNPESADVIHARDTQIFIADKLSDLNKRQLDANNVLWVELRSEQGFIKFQHIIDGIGVPHGPMRRSIDEVVDLVVPIDDTREQ